jgi:C-terminal processing protease CtpA/Prc
MRAHELGDVLWRRRVTYDLQTLKRATIIGEATGGGANPTDGFRLTDHFAIAIPVGQAVNPITKTNWEGTGVKPDVEVPPELALLTAHIMALRSRLEKATDPEVKAGLRETIGQLEAQLARAKSAPRGR